jgi:hypothetical protein
MNLALAAGVMLCLVFGQMAVKGQNAVIGTEISTYYHDQIQTYKGMPVQMTMGSIAPFGDNGVDGMIETADLIVIGRVEKTIEETAPFIESDDGEVVSALTLVPLTIKKVFKGDANLKNKQVILGQQAAILKDKKGNSYASILEGFAPFQKAKYLLFLAKSTDGKAYFPVGVYFGKHNLDGLDKEEAKTQRENVKNIGKIVKERFKDDPSY